MGYWSNPKKKLRAHDQVIGQCEFAVAWGIFLQALSPTIPSSGLDFSEQGTTPDVPPTLSP